MTNQEAIKRNQEIERRITRKATAEALMIGALSLAVAISSTLAVLAGMASKI